MVEQFKTVNTPNGQARFPSSMTDDDIAAVLRKQFPAPEQIDTKTGAPAGVRGMVGGAPEQDRLAQLKQYYPDAAPFDSDNFTFTNPETGQKTLYNEENPRIMGIPIPTAGDLASLQREAYQTLGGTVGGIVATPGALLAALPTGGTSLATIPLGVGLGAAAGDKLYDVQRAGDKGIDTRTMGQSLRDTTVVVATNAAAQRLADVLPQAAQKLVAPASKKIDENVGAFSRSGIKPTAGQATGSPALQTIEMGAANAVGGQGIIENFATKQLDDASRQINKIASGYSKRVDSLETLGGGLQKGLNKWVDSFKEISGKLYNDLDDSFSGKAISVNNTLEELSGNAGKLSDTPFIQGEAQGEFAQKYLRGLLSDIKNTAASRLPKDTELKDLYAIMEKGELPYEAVKQLRSRIGRDIADVGLIADPMRGEKKRIYAALSGDIEKAASDIGGATLQKYQMANDFYKAGIDKVDNVISSLVENKTPEKVLQAALSETKQGSTQLRNIFSVLPKSEQDAVRSFVLRDMGKPPAGSPLQAAELDFSPGTFVTNWSKLSPEAKKLLFYSNPKNKGLASALDDFVKVSKSLKTTQNYANPSGTARVSGAISLLKDTAVAGAAAGTGAYAANESGGNPFYGALAGLVAPKYAAKLMTNEKFVRWLTFASRTNTANPAKIRSLITRGIANLELTPDVVDYFVNLENSLDN